MSPVGLRLTAILGACATAQETQVHDERTDAGMAQLRAEDGSRVQHIHDFFSQTRANHTRDRGTELCDAACKADARCYAARYPDLAAAFCPQQGACLHAKLRAHYQEFGKTEPWRVYGCLKPCDGPSRSTIRSSLSCHVSKRGVPREVALRRAFCTDPESPCDLVALKTHLQSHGQLVTTCSSKEQQRQQWPLHYLRGEELARPEAGAPSDRRSVLSVIVLIFRNTFKLRIMLDSLARQQTSFAYEVIIADNGCDNGTATVIRGLKARLGRKSMLVSYLPICTNIGYAAGNNAAAKAAANSSSHLLFLNDDIELMPRFIQSLYDLILAHSTGQTQPTVAADGHERAKERAEQRRPEFERKARDLLGSHATADEVLEETNEFIDTERKQLVRMARTTVVAGGTSDDGSARNSLGVTGAVGCKLVSQNGSSLLEAGSILWRDGSALGYGRGRLPHAPEVSFTRPVDFISGACLLMPRADFARLGGFEVAAYKAYYEDTELQMRIRYHLNKSIWLQPLAIARHHEHGSFGKASRQLMIDGRQVFRDRWQAQLDASHMPHTLNLVGVLNASDRRLYTMPALLYVDVLLPRRRYGAGLPRLVDNVLSLSRLGYKVTVVGAEEHEHEAKPADDGNRASAEYDTWAKLQQAGVELVRLQDLQHALCELNDQQGSEEASEQGGGDRCIVVRLLLKLRPNLYKVIITSRPNVWHECYRHLAEYCHSPDKQQQKVGVEGVVGTCECPSGRIFDVGAFEGSNYTELACFGGNATAVRPVSPWISRRQSATTPSSVGMGVDCGSTEPTSAGLSERSTCKIIYDAEALWFRRDERLVHAADENKTSAATLPQVKAAVQANTLTRGRELSLLYAADAIITVSEEEAGYVRGVLPITIPVTVVGHSPPAVPISTTPFTSRIGILLIAGFHGSMYYNGDAAWYLVTQVYPLIARGIATNGAPPIPLTIAGSDIPQGLVAVVNASRQRKWITLKHSPRELAPLYDAARVIIIPHQYGCGVQYKLTEAMAYGVPAVVSTLTADGFGVKQPRSKRPRMKRPWFGDFDDRFCVGATTAQLATCAVQLHSDARLWQEIRRNGLHFARKVQSTDVWTSQLNRTMHITAAAAAVTSGPHGYSRARTTRPHGTR